MMQIRSNKSGFTLIEMSVVLVVIGLLLSSVLVGTSLLKSSSLRAVIREINEYTAAIQGFKSQYSALPGDMVNAANFWSTTTGGNGDGFIDWGTVPQEYPYAWQQLALAGYIPGNYNGTAGVVVGTNLPGSRMTGGGYIFGKYNSPSWLYSETTLNILSFGKLLSTGSNTSEVLNEIMTPADAYTIDLKMDDGSPTKGRLLGYTGLTIVGAAANDTLCGTGAAPNRTYNTTVNTIYCFLIYKFDN